MYPYFDVLTTVKEMTTARKKGPGAASKVGGTVKNTAAQIMMKNRDEEFDEGNQYVNGFQTKIKTFANIADQIARERFCEIDFTLFFFSVQDLKNPPQFRDPFKTKRMVISLPFLVFVNAC